MNSSGVVNQTVGSVDEAQNGITAGSWYGSGLLMSFPVVDDTPYRVKVHAFAANSDMMVFTGYAPAAPTGAGDLIAKPVFFPLTDSQNANGKFDEILLMPGLESGDSDFGKPIAFGIVISPYSTVFPTWHMSVQNLAKTAPQFAASMS